eukprot:4270773-Prymnesium_polylepis.1
MAPVAQREVEQRNGCVRAAADAGDGAAQCALGRRRARTWSIVVVSTQITIRRARHRMAAELARDACAPTLLRLILSCQAGGALRAAFVALMVACCAGKQVGA